MGFGLKHEGKEGESKVKWLGTLITLLLDHPNVAKVKCGMTLASSKILTWKYDLFLEKHAFKTFKVLKYIILIWNRSCKTLSGFSNLKHACVLYGCIYEFRECVCCVCIGYVWLSLHSYDWM